MGQISSTEFATSEPLDQTFGFPLFGSSDPSQPTQPASIGVGQSQTTGTILSLDLSIVLWRASVSVSYTSLVGAFHGYSLAYTASGQTNPDGTATLTVTDDEASGGIGFGFGIDVGVAIGVQSYSVDWVSDGWDSGFEGVWENELNLDLSVDGDLVKLILLFMQSLGEEVPSLEELDTFSEVLGDAGVYGLFGDASDEMSLAGAMTLLPSLNLSANLAELLGLEAVVAAAKAVGGEFTIGPVFSVTVPITISLFELTTDDGTYSFDTFSNGTFTFNNGPVGTLVNEIENVQITHQNAVNLTASVGIQASLELWSIIDIGGNITLVSSDDLFPGAGLGPFFGQLANENGGEAPQQTAMTLPEVVWS